jgi:hypothetical protein
MRKAAICLLVAVCLLGATSWQPQPQWRVVREIGLTNQTAGIPQTTFFTPTKAGLYRYSIYLSGTGQGGQWNLFIHYFDLSGFESNIQLQIGPSSAGYKAMWANLPVAPISAEPGVPVTFYISGSGPATYNVGMTLEQLE